MYVYAYICIYKQLDICVYRLTYIHVFMYIKLLYRNLSTLADKKKIRPPLLSLLPCPPLSSPLLPSPLLSSPLSLVPLIIYTH